MAKCEQCGAVTSEGKALCAGCEAETLPNSPEQGGARPPKTQHSFGGICGECGALLPDHCKACLVCGTPCGEKPFRGEFPVVPEEPAAPTPPPQRQHGRKAPEVWRRWGTGLASLLVVAIVSVAGFGVYRQYFDTSSYRAGEAVVYESAGNRLMLSYPGAAHAIEITGIERPAGGYGSGGMQAAPGGRRLAYTAADGGLYLVDLAAQRQLDSEQQLQAEQLVDAMSGEPEFSKNGRQLVYLTGKQELMVTNFTESWLVDTGVAEVLAVGSANILYTSLDEHGKGQTGLYLAHLSKDNSECLLISRGVDQVLDWTPDFEKIIYTSIREGADGNPSTSMQMYVLDTSTTTIMASEIGGVVDASAEKGTAVYLVPHRQLWDYEDFIEDDLAEQDLLATEPVLADYPLVAQAVALYGEQGDFSDSEENEALVEEDRRYRAAQQAWAEKLERDALRKQYYTQFLNSTEHILLYDLYVYRAGKQQKLDSDVWAPSSISSEQGQVSAAQGYVFYETIDPQSLVRMKLSALWKNPDRQRFSLQEYYLAHVTRELRFSMLDAAPSRLHAYGEEQAAIQWRASSKLDGIYFTVGRPQSAAQSELYFAPLQGSVPGDAVLVDKGVDQIVCPFRDGMLYTTGPGEERRLHVVQSGSAQQLGNVRVEPGSIENDGATALYLDSYRQSTTTGDLYLYARQERLIASDVMGYQYHSDESIYLVRRGGTSGARDIYLWQNGREIPVEVDTNGALEIR